MAQREQSSTKKLISLELSQNILKSEQKFIY